MKALSRLKINTRIDYNDTKLSTFWLQHNSEVVVEMAITGWSRTKKNIVDGNGQLVCMLIALLITASSSLFI